MNLIRRADVNRLQKYLDDLRRKNPKPSYEIELMALSNLLNKVGFDGPKNRPGPARGFSHELLKNNPMLVDGQFTVHVLHGRKVELISFRDFKRYMSPYIDQVMKELEEKDLIQEEDANA